MIRKIAISDVHSVRKYVIHRCRRQDFMNGKLSLPAKKNLQIANVEQPKGSKVLSSSKCSDYEPIDYCSPLFP